MPQPVAIHFKAVHVEGRLFDLGLNQALLADAVRDGTSYQRDCTLHDPPNLGGMIAWGKTVRALRDRLVPHGWDCANDRNYATTIHPRRAMAIAVASGDLSTGKLDRTPSTRTDKGPATRDVILQNQLSFAQISSDFPVPATAEGISTWLLLYHVDNAAREIRVELSLPISMTVDGFVTGWRERIILAPIALDPLPSPREYADGGEIEVRVERRAI